MKNDRNTVLIDELASLIGDCQQFSQLDLTYVGEDSYYCKWVAHEISVKTAVQRQRTNYRPNGLDNMMCPVQSIRPSVNIETIGKVWWTYLYM